MFSKVTLLAAVALVSGLVCATPIPRTTAHTGDVTWFNPGLGACGKYNTDSDLIVALSASVFDTFSNGSTNPNNNLSCGRKITAKTTNGKSVTVTVADRCIGCASGDLDMSPAAFKVLASLDVGRLHGVKWSL